MGGRALFLLQYNFPYNASFHFPGIFYGIFGCIKYQCVLCGFGCFQCTIWKCSALITFWSLAAGAI